MNGKQVNLDEILNLIEKRANRFEKNAHSAIREGDEDKKNLWLEKCLTLIYLEEALKYEFGYYE